jgi:hypothetical protein
VTYVDLDAALRELAGADVVAFAGVGLMSRVLPATEAYRVLVAAVDRDGAALRPHLDRLLRHGTPAGKVYGASLLARLDPTAARQEWGRLAKDTSAFTTFTGCIMNRTTLAEYAAAQ